MSSSENDISNFALYSFFSSSNYSFISIFTFFMISSLISFFYWGDISSNFSSNFQSIYSPSKGSTPFIIHSLYVGLFNTDFFISRIDEDANTFLFLDILYFWICHYTVIWQNSLISIIFNLHVIEFLSQYFIHNSNMNLNSNFAYQRILSNNHVVL
jgi:hypothetical protein